HAALRDVSGARIVTWNLDGPPPQRDIDIVVAPYLVGPAPLAALSQVHTRLVQWPSIGYDGVTDHLPQGVPFANAATVHETSTAELAVTLALAAQREIPEFVR